MHYTTGKHDMSNEKLVDLENRIVERLSWLRDGSPIDMQGFTADIEAMLLQAHAAEAAHTPCRVCGEDEPHTGACGSNDPRALCNAKAAQPQAQNSEWVMVPREPRGVMAEQGAVRQAEWNTCKSVQDTYDLFRRQWARAIAAAPQPQPAQDAKDAALLEWAARRWRAEVLHRPLVNVHRRTLDDTWRQVIRHAGGDDVVICGPRHDDLVVMAKESGR